MRRFAPLFAAAAILLGVLGLFAVVKLTSSSSDNRDFTTLAKPPLEVVRSYLTTAKQRLFKNDYDGATSALSEAESILEAEPDGIALLEVGAMKEEISFSSAEYARLSSSGDVDEEEYGRFLCFVKGDWDKGLEVLVKKGKSPLKELAELDLRNPSGVKGRIAVADGWYEVGAKEESKRRQGRIWDRAFAWYQAVLPDLVGAERTRVTERIESLDETLASRQTVDLIGLLNPDKFSIRGKFLISRARVLTPGGTGHARMEVPYLPPDEYDLTVVAERKSGSDYLYFGVVAAGRQIGFALDKGATHSLVESTDASHSKPLFPKGKRVSLTFAVRESSLTVTAEGSEIFRIDPRGPFLRDGIVPEWSVNHPNVLFFGSHHSQFEIRKMTLQVVPGLGGRAFPADVTPLATRRTLDLLASVDPARDAVGGEWSLRGGALVSDGSRYARLQVPYHPPEEYDFTITFSREGAGQDVAQIATRAERAFNWDMAGNRDTFGFGLVGGRWTTDSDNPTVVKVAGGLDSKRSYMSVLKVRKSGVSACLEGRLITQWKAGDPELSVNPDWKLADPKRLGLGNWHSPTVYHRIEVTELSGPGTLLRKPLRKVGAGGVPIDLLKLVRPVKDAIKGNFGLDGNVLVTPHGIPWARLETPYEPPAEYDLTLEIERVTGTNALVLGLAADGVQFPVYLHGRIGRGVPLSGIDSASGKRFYENETTYTGPVLDLRKRTTVECEVRTTGVRVVADGKELFDWKGDYHALSVREDWRVPRKRVLFIGSYESLFRISRATLIPRSLGGRVPGKSPLDGRSIDLLARIDAEKDAIAGIFERKGNVILTPHRTSWARLQVKAKWPREYDLRLRVERDEGEDSFNIVPVWNGRKFSISIDAHGPTQHDVTGLDFIDKKEFFRNETTTQGPFLLVGRESTIVISIRRTHITLTIDGREIFTWRGNPSRLSIPAGWKVPDANGLSLGSYDSRFKIKEFTLIPLREW